MTTSSFADFAATAQDRADDAANVYHYTEILCEALVQNFIEYNTHSMKRSALTAETKSEAEYYTNRAKEIAEKPDYSFTIETGRKYLKVIMNDCTGSSSVHAFVDKKTGELYKPAGWRAPAKHVRGNLLDSASREDVLSRCDWAGGYLYIRWHPTHYTLYYIGHPAFTLMSAPNFYIVAEGNAYALDNDGTPYGAAVFQDGSVDWDNSYDLEPDENDIEYVAHMCQILVQAQGLTIEHNNEVFVKWVNQTH